MKNAVLDVIRSRRSVRRYRPDPVPPEALEAVLEAALWAPSACDGQPWHFTALVSPERIAQIDREACAFLARAPLDWAAAMGRAANFRIFYGAPAVVVVSGLKDAEFHTAVDCAIAAQNMVLAAESLGLSSCWIGLTPWYFQSEGARRDLEIPEGYEPHFAIALGYREGPAPEEPERRGHPVTVLR